MQLWPRASLVRRIVLVLLAAFLLVWAVLLVSEYATFKRQLWRQDGLGQLAQILIAALDFDDVERARIVLAASETQYNLSRRQGPLADAGDILLLLLEKADGTPVYASAPARGRRIPSADSGSGSVEIDARAYWSLIHTTPRWRLQLLYPVIEDMDILQFLSSELVPSLLIAFPFVLLPVWIAVRRGLSPLRVFVAQVAERDQNDFSPQELQLRYAELQPLSIAFNDLLAKTRHGIARERAFVQDAAHELRTPLAVVAAQAHVLANAVDDGQRRQAQSALEQSVTRASHLVRQLLTLAALESGATRTVQGTDLVQTAREILIVAMAAARAKNIEIVLESADRLEDNLDTEAFHSVLENLLANAIAYSPEGAHVMVSLESEGEWLRLRVADNGPGITAEELPHIFDRFYRGRSVAVCGSGLGLAIVQQAVDNMGGAIEVLPGLDGRGAAFEVRWPLGVQ
jgi:two-component system sensor histidine kinase QseC